MRFLMSEMTPALLPSRAESELTNLRSSSWLPCVTDGRSPARRWSSASAALYSGWTDQRGSVVLSHWRRPSVGTPSFTSGALRASA